jgi:hypothetical protein
MHRQKHPVDVPGCFGCKLLSMHYGTVPGASRQSSGTYYDKESLIASGLNISEEEVRDQRATFAHAMAELEADL